MTQTSHNQSPEAGEEQPFISHLVELRDRLLRIVLVVTVILLGLMPFANRWFTLLAEPLTAHLPEGSPMVAIDIVSPFFTPFKLALVTAIFVAMPYILYQAWAFIAPGLYQHERKRVFPLLLSSTLLFYLGAAFAYFVVFPLVVMFIFEWAPAVITWTPDIARFLDFALTLFFAFGLAFEVPVATVLLVWTGVVTPEALRGKRAYVIVAAFVIGMLLTPPDIISQTLLAVPMWMLFEVGVFMSRYFVPEADTTETPYQPMNEGEMDEELDRIEREEESARDS
jgi:sec-independent protein translocase protein TatC